jgi:hypothetical protein
MTEGLVLRPFLLYITFKPWIEWFPCHLFEWHVFKMHTGLKVIVECWWVLVAISMYSEEWEYKLFFLQLPNPGNRLKCKKVSVICPESVF